ncbi:glycosyltransferase [Neokomagataea thailandica]|uniref:Glycosyltransferase n=1 Tax=Neokomagataea tanensis NBRC 106556 TaxID=1223519 RepID=A0ABQ0QG96_9PROT|nr:MULTISPECIES: glycosyltransferase [Neokomagataea]GBR43660.1 glycosyltransferase [Neokomagataea tanensis NBRC 106556]
MADDSKVVTLTDRAGSGYAGYGNVITEADRALWRKVYAERAQDAFQRGERALACNDLAAARFWLERAGRMARMSPNVTWALALVDMRTGHFNDALHKMKDLEERFRLREAAFLAVVCLVRLQRWEEALQKLRHALSVSVIMPDLHHIADHVVRVAQKPGWCFASNAGYVHVVAEGRVTVTLDGECVSIGQSGQHKLPSGWGKARHIAVKLRGRHLVGSPIDIGALTRFESLATVDAGCVCGWAWFPSEPEHDPRLRLWDGTLCAASGNAETIESDVPLARPRAFRVPIPAALVHSATLLALYDDHGRMLTGAPLRADLGSLMEGPSDALLSDMRPYPVQQVERCVGVEREPVQGCCVVIPVYRNYRVTLDCLESVLATVSAQTRVIVVDDATPEEKLARALDDYAEQGRIELVRLEQNRGFPVAVNMGLARAVGHDVVLLNSDTVVPPGWLERLLRRLHVHGVGTVTPFSNDASIFSYPSVDEPNPVPSVREAFGYDRLCQKLFREDEANDDAPTANGFCMAISAQCLREVGFLREDVFAQGYGEENDFCLRAHRLGFRHRMAPDVYVLHRGSISFGAGKRWLMARNLDILNALHPGYEAYVADFQQRDPFRGWRRRLDQARLGRDVSAHGPAVAMIVHAGGGGVERVVRERAAAFEGKGQAAYVLRPVERGCHVTRPMATRDTKKVEPLNFVFDLPDEEADLVAALSALGVQHIEWHQLIGHAECVRTLHVALGVPYDVFVHDHVWFCPRVSLLDGHGRYCGEPDVAGCEQCVARWGDVLNEGLSIGERLARSKYEFSKARRCITPSHDTARRFKRHFPSTNFIVEQLEQNAAFEGNSERNIPGPVPGRVLKLCVVGGIGQWKGYDVLLNMARDIRFHSLPVKIILVGHTPNDDELMYEGVIVTGEYKEDEVYNLIKEYNPDIGFIPSISPETWCYALSILWKAGLEVMCFDIGAQAERVRERKGVILPLGASSLQLLHFILSRWYRLV